MYEVDYKKELNLEKLKIAMYWGAACGGCDISVLEIGEHILDLVAVADIVFWPAALDFKYEDVEKLPEKYIDVCLFNGAIRTSENKHIAELLRAKSKILVAFGSCAVEGCIPGLANLKKREDILSRVFIETPTTFNPEGLIPRVNVNVPEGEVELPAFSEKVETLAQVVDVDYFMPGCPPVGEQAWTGIQTLIGGSLPPKKSYLGCGTRALCEECPRKREKKKVKKIYRNYQLVPNTEDCLLEQGLLCVGPATREGCGAQCIKANMPCIGCYGPIPENSDQGAKMISALTSTLDAVSDIEAKAILNDLVDPVGTFYYFSVANSVLKRSKP
jgi:F420-non-reducing hydrogenase small subunit